MAGKYKIKYRGCDGSDVTTFSTLNQVARYLKGRDLGPDYRRAGCLQGEYALFSFEGFGWADILDGDPKGSATKYKAALVNDVKLVYREKKDAPRGPINVFDRLRAEMHETGYRLWEAKDGPEPVGRVTAFAPGHDPAEPYRAVFGHRTSGPPAATLDEAKAWLVGQYLDEVRVVETAPVEPGDQYRDEY